MSTPAGEKSTNRAMIANVRHRQQLEFTSAKRLSIIDRGKSWARQFIRINKHLPHSFTQRSIESTDSGIDTTNSINSSSSCSSPNAIAKMPTSFSCTFISSSLASECESLRKSPINECASSTSSSSSSSSNHDTNYDPVYSSSTTSNSTSSKASSSAYLMSPIDEAGYLVPLSLFSLKGGPREPEIVKENSDDIYRARKPSYTPFRAKASQLTRSFSTRSAYVPPSKQQSSLQSSFSKFNSNRITICDENSLFTMTNNNIDEDATQQHKRDTEKSEKSLPDYATSEAATSNTTKSSCSLLQAPCIPLPALPVEEPLVKSPDQPPPHPRVLQSHQPQTPVAKSETNSAVTSPTALSPPPLPSQPPPSLSSLLQSFASPTAPQIKQSQSSFILLSAPAVQANNSAPNLNHSLINLGAAIKITPLVICSSDPKSPLVFKPADTKAGNYLNSLRICNCDTCLSNLSNYFALNKLNYTNLEERIVDPYASTECARNSGSQSVQQRKEAPRNSDSSRNHSRLSCHASFQSTTSASSSAATPDKDFYSSKFGFSKPPSKANETTETNLEDLNEFVSLSSLSSSSQLNIYQLDSHLIRSSTPHNISEDPLADSRTLLESDQNATKNDAYSSSASSTTSSASTSSSSFHSTENTLDNEPILYIDSAELDENLAKLSLRPKDSGMNQLLAKFRPNSAVVESGESVKLKSARPLNKISPNSASSGASRKQSGSRSHQQPHDYHAIDEVLAENENPLTSALSKLSLPKSSRRNLSPTNSVESFEFVSSMPQSNSVSFHQILNTTNVSESNCSPRANPTTDLNNNNNNNSNNASYEKSWENSALLLLEKINKQSQEETARSKKSSLKKSASKQESIDKLKANSLRDKSSQSFLKSCRNRFSMINATTTDHNSSSITKGQSDSGAANSRSHASSLLPLNPTNVNNNNNNSTLQSFSSASSLSSPSPCSSSLSQSSPQPSDHHHHTGNNATSTPAARSPRNAANGDEDFEHLLSISTANESEKLLDTTNSSLLLKASNAGRNYVVTCVPETEVYDETPGNEVWYQPTLPRESVHAVLSNQEIGSFVIRMSNSCKDCYALSIRVPYFANPTGIAHYLITKNAKGFKLKGVEKEFRSLRSLVTHYSVMQEILPVTLNATSSHNSTLMNSMTESNSKNHYSSEPKNKSLANQPNFSCLVK